MEKEMKNEREILINTNLMIRSILSKMEVNINNDKLFIKKSSFDLECERNTVNSIQ